MNKKLWIEYRFVVRQGAPPQGHKWYLEQRSVMGADFQPRANRLAEGGIAAGQLVAYVLVNCDDGGSPIILTGHDGLADRMFKQRLPGARLT